MSYIIKNSQYVTFIPLSPECPSLLQTILPCFLTEDLLNCRNYSHCSTLPLGLGFPKADASLPISYVETILYCLTFLKGNSSSLSIPFTSLVNSLRTSSRLSSSHLPTPPFFPVQDECSHLKIHSLLCVYDVSVGVSMPHGRVEARGCGVSQWTQVIRMVQSVLYPLSHLANPLPFLRWDLQSGLKLMVLSLAS